MSDTYLPVKVDIFYEGEPFNAGVDNYSDQPIRCVPMICIKSSNPRTEIGIGVLFGKDLAYCNFYASPFDLFAAYRATEMIRLYDLIKESDIKDVYFAAIRNSGCQQEIASITNRIEVENYEKIMAMKIPDKIIDLFLKEKDFQTLPVFHSIYLEIKEGTIEWRDEFTAFGIKSKEQYLVEKEERKKILMAYEPIFTSLFKYSCEEADFSLREKVEITLTGILEDIPYFAETTDEQIQVAVAYVKYQCYVFEPCCEMIGITPNEEDYLAYQENIVSGAIGWLVDTWNKFHEYIDSPGLEYVIRKHMFDAMLIINSNETEIDLH